MKNIIRNKTICECSHVLYYDLLSIAACFGVVLMHCNTDVWNFSPSYKWVIKLLAETLFYWDVPVFFMLIGAKNLNYRKSYSTKIFLKKRMYKTFIPYIVWSIIALVLAIMFGKEDINNLNIKELINSILTSKYNYAYWFFLALFPVYLSIPVLSLIDEDKRYKVYIYISALAFLTYSVYPQIAPEYIYLNSDLQFPLSNGWLMYILLGWLIAYIDIKKSARIVIYLLGFTGWALRFFGMLFNCWKYERIYYAFCGYCNFATVFFACAVFVFFKYNKWKMFNNKLISKYIPVVSSCTFGVYLIHNFFAMYLPQLLNADITSLKWIFSFSIVLFIGSFIFIFFIKKIPILKRLVP